MKAAYRDFKKQQPRPVPATPPYTPTDSKHEPVPPVTGPVPPLTLLLAPNDVKPTQTTVIHHEAKWRIPEHEMTAEDRRWNQASIVDLGAGKFPIWRVGGGGAHSRK